MVGARRRTPEAREADQVRRREFGRSDIRTAPCRRPTNRGRPHPDAAASARISREILRVSTTFAGARRLAPRPSKSPDIARFAPCRRAEGDLRKRWRPLPGTHDVRQPMRLSSEFDDLPVTDEVGVPDWNRLTCQT